MNFSFVWKITQNVHAFHQKVVKKEKGPAPPPPSLPNAVAAVTTKDAIEEKLVSDASNADDSDNKPHRKEIIEQPTTTTLEDASSQPEVCIINQNLQFDQAYCLIRMDLLICQQFHFRSIGPIRRRSFRCAMPTQRHLVHRTVAAFQCHHQHQRLQPIKMQQPINQ